MVFTNSMSIVGVMYFIFLSAVKMDKSRIITAARKSMNVGLTCFIVPLIIVFSLFYIFHDSITGIQGGSFHLYISASLSLSYFPVITDAASELKMLTSELGTIAMSCSILHEILGWFLLLLSVFLQEGDLHYTIESVVAMSVLMLFTILVLRPMVQCIIRRIQEGKPVDGFYIKAILVGPLIMGFLSDMIGATILPGALIMGLIIPAGPPLGSSLVEKSELIISELVLPFMYIRIGQLTNVYSIADWKAFTTVQFILLAGFLGKMAGCLLSLLCSNNGGVRNSFLLGLFLNTKGVIELSLTLRWRARKLIDEPVFATLVIYYIVVTAIVTPLLQIFNKPQGRLEATSSMKNTTRSLQATLLTSELQIMCCFHYEENVHGIITLLKSCNSTGISSMCIYAAHLIDLVGRAAPLLHPYSSQRKRFRENSTDRIMKVLKTSLIKGSSSPVTIQPFRVIAPYDTIHESICRLARDKYIPLVLVPFPENLDTHGRKSALHSFNILMQAYAPCTVGILVDRSLPRIFSSIYFTYNIGVLFLGGPDDREALALVLRISDHPGVSIMVLRIDLRGEKFENQSEKYLDDCLVSEFKARNIGNASVVCRKLVAENTMQVVDSIRSLENNYDLVIVGSSSMTNSDERSRFFSSSSSFDNLDQDLSVKKGPNKGSDDRMKGILTVLSLFALTLFSIFVLRPLILQVIRKISDGKPVNGNYVSAILLAPLITGVLSDVLGSTFFPGALLIGLIIPAGPPLGSVLVEKCELILSEILLPFLYIQVGVLTNVYSITNREAFGYFHMTLAIGYAGKVAGSLLSMLFFKTSFRNAFLLAFILNIKGVLELTISVRFRMLKFMDETIFTVFVLSNMLVSAIMAPLIQIFYKPQTRLEGSDLTEICTRTVQATPLVSQLRVLCCIHCEDNVPGILTLLNAMNVTENGPIGSYPVHLTELIGRSTPLLEPYDTKNMRRMRHSTDRIMKALSKYLKSSNFSVTIQPFRIISPYKIMHDFICKLAQDVCIPLIILPFPESLEILGKTTSLRSLILGVEEQSPCTVGIFLDRCPPRFLGSTELPFKVAVFFFGGADDREALALVMRMLGNHGVRIKFFRIHLTGALQENYMEKNLDDYFVKEFRDKNIGNPGLEYHELEANVSEQVMDTIRSVENKYDLVVVGKRRGPKSQLDEEMNPWVEHKELGVIGDMLASSDFGGGFMSVLVMHCLGSIDGSMRISDNFQGLDQVAENRDSESLLKKFRFSGPDS
ncbi:hypothetical protein EZV62_025917 [Acer yangbiense]|uniref:Cation/H+ exchanger domain-containing protein n=1 Tax=Acer yangbiense TaxID=1000413 RepID=A0A5C7H0P2_9ROSI|nr:hypothetical protein EZV62_025917 [Acer yangbiense]